MRKYLISSVWFYIFSVNVFILFSAGCQSAHEDREYPSDTIKNEDGADEDFVFSMEKHDAEDIKSIALELTEILGEVSGEATGISAVNYQELQKLLPKRVNGVSPTIKDGQTIGIGSGFSKVRGEYEDGDQVVTVTILDLAGFGRVAAHSLSDWLGEEIDQESDRGFERTQVFRSRTKEYPTYERYYNERGHESCEFHSWVEDRFLVAISGDGVPMSVCESTRDRISFRRLERLADSTDD